MGTKGRAVAETQGLRLCFGGGHVEISDPATQLQHRSRLDFQTLKTKPFLKWPGGKQWLAPIAQALVPPRFQGRYFEPFLGGGALFFALKPNAATLSDVNPELLATYQAVRDEPDQLIKLLRSYPHDEGFFLTLRKRRTRSGATTGARLIYLNKTAFNGMYRVNARGEFNVPFGSYSNPTICQEGRIRSASAALALATLRCVDFSAAVSDAQAGDFVFLDPPYITGHQNNGFHKYNAQLFDWASQERLHKDVNTLIRRGVRVAMTNADHPSIRSLYSRMHVTSIMRTSLINATAEKRGPVAEALYTSHRLSPHRIAEAAEGAGR